MRGWIVVYLLVAVFWGAMPAAAGEGDGVVPDPEGQWRVLTLDGGTSRCIGDTRTPVCAIETLLACQARQQRELCAIALSDADPKIQYPDIRLHDPHNKLEYRIWDVPTDIDWLEPGDIMVLTFERECPAQSKTCAQVLEEPYAYQVRRSGDDRWIVSTHVYTGGAD